LQRLLNVFLSLNLLQLLSILGLNYLQRSKATNPAPVNSNQDEGQPLLIDQRPPYVPAGGVLSPAANGHAKRLSIASNKGEVQRGKIFMILSAISIAFTWILFLGTAWFRLGKKAGGNN
jgi:hypothetical protein